MRKIHKIANIALIFTLIGVVVCGGVSYASNLRVPFGGYGRLEKKTERARQMKLIKEFEKDYDDDMASVAIFVEKLTHGMFKLVEFIGSKMLRDEAVLVEVEEVATTKKWFLRCEFYNTVKSVRLAKRIAKKMDSNSILKRHLPEIRFDPYDTNSYYLTSKEGDVDLDIYLNRRDPSPEQILAIGNQIIDFFEELEKYEKGNPGIYFWDNATPSQYRVDLTSNSVKPRVIFVDIGIEGFSSDGGTNLVDLLSYVNLLRGLYYRFLTSTDKSHSDYEIIDFFRQRDDGFRPDKKPASNESIIKPLSSDDKKTIDNGLDLLDSMQNPKDVVGIVEKVFDNRGLMLDLGLERREGRIDILGKEDGSWVGYRDFDISTNKNKIGFYNGRFITGEMDRFKGKRLFPLLYRWMSAHPYFSKFSGWKIRIEFPPPQEELAKANSMAARSWWRSGFPIEIVSESGRIIKRLEDITDKEEYYIEGTFLAWKAKTKDDPDKPLTSGETVEILKPQEGILQLKTKIAEAAYAHKDDKVHCIAILIDGEHHVGKSTFIESFCKSVNLQGWPVVTDAQDPGSKRWIHIWQAWDGIGTDTHFGLKQTPDFVTAIAVYLSSTNDKSRLPLRIIEHADIVIDSRGVVRLPIPKMAELLGQGFSSRKDI